MSRSSYEPDDYDLEQQHEFNRRLEIATEQEPSLVQRGFRAPYRRARRPRRRPRYSFGLPLRPVRVEMTVEPKNAPDPTIDGAA
jgi:hypothetical protein